MSNQKNRVGNIPGDAPTWDERTQYFRMRRWLRLLILLVIASGPLLILWILFYAPISEAASFPLEPSASIVVILAPILGAGLLVERVLEVSFAIFEGSWKTMVAYLGRGMRWLKIAETEVLAARSWMLKVSSRYSGEIDSINMDATKSLITLKKELNPKVDAANELWQMAERRLIKAEEQFSALVTFDRYRSAKAIATLAIGLLMGLVIATISQLQIFAMLGIGSVPARIDVLISGLIIGVSAQPIHTIIARLDYLVDRLTGSYAKKIGIDLEKP